MTEFEIPLRFRKPPEWPDAARPPALIYDAEAYAAAPGRSMQPVLAGRTVLKPRIDLSRYQAKAVIDWIKIRLATPGRHQAVNMHRTVNRMLGRQGGATSVYVSGPHDEERHHGNQFCLKFQDPAPRSFKALLHEIAEYYDADTNSIEDLPIAGIEISVDFYVRKSLELNDDDRDLCRWQMVELLRRHLRPEAVLTEEDYCRPRTFGSEHENSGATFVLKTRGSIVSGDLVRHFHRLGVDERHRPALQRAAHNQPPVDHTYWVGARDFLVALRSMDKITDRRDPKTGDAIQLAPDDCRARLEVTLQGTSDIVGGHGAVDLTTVGDLFGFKFQGIRKPLFEFFLPTLGAPCETDSLPFPVQVTEQEVFKRSGVYGLDRLHRAIEAVNHAAYERGEIPDEPVRLRKKGRLMSYEELNRRFDTALKGLTRDWKR